MDKNASITTNHQLLTACWAADVRELQAAVGRFSAGEAVTNGCRIMFFEMPGDRDLHVNVTHTLKTTSPTGWAGPADTSEGFVHNRRFAAAAPELIARQLRTMVYARRA